MVLSDRTIKEELAKGRIVIEPLDPSDIQPASVDLHLDKKLLVFRNTRQPYIDVRKDLPDLTEIEEIPDDTPFILHPGEFVLASTLEYIKSRQPSPCPTTWWPGWRGRAPWEELACSFTPPPAMWTPAGAVT